MTYMWKCGAQFEHITLKESRTTIESGTTGLKTWLASLVLAQYLLSHPGSIFNASASTIVEHDLELVTSRSVLELGSGIGFLGIVTAFLQTQTPSTSSKIFLTDVNTEVLARCSENLTLPCSKRLRSSPLLCISLNYR